MSWFVTTSRCANRRCSPEASAAGSVETFRGCMFIRHAIQSAGISEEVLALRADLITGRQAQPLARSLINNPMRCGVLRGPFLGHFQVLPNAARRNAVTLSNGAQKIGDGFTEARVGLDQMLCELSFHPLLQFSHHWLPVLSVYRPTNRHCYSQPPHMASQIERSRRSRHRDPLGPRPPGDRCPAPTPHCWAHCSPA